MDWTLDKSRPIGRQICEKISVAIAFGEIAAGQRLMSVRELALLASVNPNTVQKAFEELERQGIIRSVPSSGWFVLENTEAARDEVELLRCKCAIEYLSAMASLGCAPEASTEYLKRAIEERKDGKHE